MINPFTISAKISRLQQEVLRPLYNMHSEQESAQHDWLLVLTGRVIEKNRLFLEDIASSSLVAVIFKIVKLFGGADELSEADFDRFTAYVNAGGLKSMVNMLLAADKQQTFLTELRKLPLANRENAQPLLKKSAELHEDFIKGFFVEQYGSLQKTPPKLIANFEKSTEFILQLADLAGKELKNTST
jgi:hypothetical protein